MAGYYNPYNFYQNSTPIMGGAGFTPYNGYSYVPQPQQSQVMEGMKWVEGEVGAKAFQMPQNWPANQPIPLWDSTDTVIYLKSWGPMGVPNPMQVLHYTMPDQQAPQLPAQTEQQVSSASAPNYVTKEDFDALRNEMKEVLAKLNANKNQRYKQEENHG